MKLNEFEIIENFFAQQPIHRDDVVLGIGDDGAIVNSPANQAIVITTDTLLSGTHFPVNTSAYDIGYKSLAVNLSDLAAMGATPAWFTLSLTLPAADEKWLLEFCRGLFALAKKYNLQLIGGDITRGPLSITIGAHGFTPPKQALTRSHAKPGDLIYVTNSLGDAAVGLLLQQKKISIPSHFHEYFLKHLNQPEPRIEVGEQLRQIAHATIDISDGLTADLGHILKQSDVGALVYCEQIPLSAAMQESVSFDIAILFALTGGDDYELCFTAPPDKKNLLKNFSCIGIITEEKKLDLRMKNGTSFQGTLDGYKHFL